MRMSHLLENRGNRLRGAGMAALTLAALVLPLAVAAQTTYHDPHGRFDLQVPAGWQIALDQGVDQVIVRKGAVQAIVVVLQQNKSDAVTGQQFVDVTAKEFQDQCPTFHARQSGTLILAGAPGIYSLFTCSDPKSPSVAETSAALTKNAVLIGFTAIAPLAEYYASLPALDGIRNSLSVMGGETAAAASNAHESQPMAELRKACAVGAFTQDDCARRIGILLGQEAKTGADTSDPSAGLVYRDPTGRFSLQVPRGWTATSEGENGVLGVQLRSGSDWINIMPAESAASASQVVLQDEQRVALKSDSARKIPFGTLGIVQIFGNGLEVAYDHFSATSPQGDAIESYIGGVGEISGTGRIFLLLKTSFGAEKRTQTGALFLSVARSIRLTAH
jgi:hypothetical protein